MVFKLTEIPLEKIQLREGLKADEAGAFASFEGRVRNHNEGKIVTYLEYEAKDTLAQEEAKKIFEEAKKRFSVINIRCYHRLGRCEIGEMAVWVGVIAAHRDDAFKACRFIIDELKKRLPIWKKEHYDDGSESWVSCACKDEEGDVEAGSLEANEQEYFSRQINLPEIGNEGQKKLKQAKVLVAGAGGLGCPALMSLAGAGVGTIGICEHDKIELSNLHRQFLYSFDDVGASKVQVAKQKINALNPSVDAIEHHEKLHLDNIDPILDPYDIILDCTDDITVKYLLNDACFLKQKTLIQAGIFQWEGQLRVMIPKQKGCLRCLWPNIPHPDCVGTCVDGGVLGVIPNIFGQLQAMEALRIILDMQKVFQNELLILNVADFHIRRLKIKPEENCPLCSEEATIREMCPENYEPQAEYLIDPKGLNADELSAYTLVDVRDLEERQENPLLQMESEHVPVSQFTEESFPFAKDKKYLLFCEKGIRSSRFAQMLRELGYDNVFSAKDGIESLRIRLSSNSATSQS